MSNWRFIGIIAAVERDITPDVLNLRALVGSVFAAHHNSLSVRKVPIPTEIVIFSNGCYGHKPVVARLEM